MPYSRPRVVDNVPFRTVRPISRRLRTTVMAPAIADDQRTALWKKDTRSDGTVLTHHWFIRDEELDRRMRVLRIARSLQRVADELEEPAIRKGSHPDAI